MLLAYFAAFFRRQDIRVHFTPHLVFTLFRITPLENGIFDNGRSYCMPPLLFIFFFLWFPLSAQSLAVIIGIRYKQTQASDGRGKILASGCLHIPDEQVRKRFLFFFLSGLLKILFLGYMYFYRVGVIAMS